MIEFTKAHGNGNDFVIVDEWEGERVDEDEKSGFAARYCDRRTGIGGDGVVFLSSAGDDADARMLLYQPDGDPVEMCGNALRCVARFCVERRYFDAGEAFVVETGAGDREVSWNGDRAEVEMGAPSFEADDVPARRELVEEGVRGRVVTAVNTGVPHAVTFVEDIDEVAVGDEAPPVRHADVFPEGANVNFVEEDGRIPCPDVRTRRRRRVRRLAARALSRSPRSRVVSVAQETKCASRHAAAELASSSTAASLTYAETPNSSTKERRCRRVAAQFAVLPNCCGKPSV